MRKVSHQGRISEWTLNPLWVRLDREMHEEFGIERLFLVSHGRRLPIAGFLGPREKESFAAALSAALGEAKRGPTRTVFDSGPIRSSPALAARYDANFGIGPLAHSMILVPLLNPKFAIELAARCARTSGSGH